MPSWETSYVLAACTDNAPEPLRRYHRHFYGAAASALAVFLLLCNEIAHNGESTGELLPSLMSQQQPPTIISSDARGWLNYTLDVDVGVWRLPRGISFSTRLYNGLAPSPVLWAQPGDRVRLRVLNRLGPNSPTQPAAPNFREANTTNLHLHGIHDDANHDDTFARVRDGQQKVYEYDLEPSSGTSLIYYHPHADGSTSLQSLGGMGGVLVIEDRAQEEQLGLRPSATHVALLQALDFNPSSKDYLGTQLTNEGTSLMDASISNPTRFEGLMLLNLLKEVFVP